MEKTQKLSIVTLLVVLGLFVTQTQAALTADYVEAAMGSGSVFLDVGPGTYTRSGLTATTTANLASDWNWPDTSDADYFVANCLDDKSDSAGDFLVTISGFSAGQNVDLSVQVLGKDSDVPGYDFSWGTAANGAAVNTVSDVTVGTEIYSGSVMSTFAVDLGTFTADSSGNVAVWLGNGTNYNGDYRTEMDGIVAIPESIPGLTAEYVEAAIGGDSVFLDLGPGTYTRSGLTATTTANLASDWNWPDSSDIDYFVSKCLDDKYDSGADFLVTISGFSAGQEVDLSVQVLGKDSDVAGYDFSCGYASDGAAIYTISDVTTGTEIYYDDGMSTFVVNLGTFTANSSGNVGVWLGNGINYNGDYRTEIDGVVVGFPAETPLEKGPYLIYPGVNTKMQVLWQVTNTQSCTIEWGSDRTYSLGSAGTTEYGTDHQHSYTISGLSPGTKYYYRVSADSNYHTGSFNTAPADSASNLKFFAYGDTRSYPSDQDTVIEQVIDTYTLDPEFQTLILHVGDWTNDDSEGDWTNEYFPTSYANLLQFKKELPVNGCKGNHDDNGLFEKYWPYPYQSDFYWSFDYGPAHIVILDQYTAYTSGSTQHTWLVNDLANTTKEWKFIVLHEPGWTAGGHENNLTVQSVIQPLCLQYGVDVVFGGHNHYYARCDVDGVQHVTTGGGGAPLYAPNMSAENLVTASEVYQHTEITITGDQLDFVARKNDGSVIDTFTVSHTLTQILYDDFESSYGNWVDGGTDCIRYTGATYAYQGSDAINLQDNGTTSNMSTNNLALSSYSRVIVDFAYICIGMDAGESFLLEISTDGGSNYAAVKEWTLNDEFVNNQFYTESVTIAGYTLNDQTRLRFRCDGSVDTDDVYIDTITVSAQ